MFARLSGLLVESSAIHVTLSQILFDGPTRRYVRQGPGTDVHKAQANSYPLAEGGQS